MFNPPPKLSYAKVRNKSKNKNQSSSQQKIVFDNQSSTDIFAHLNQDNLNYIKKQIKNKKAQISQIQSSHSQEINKKSESLTNEQNISSQQPAFTTFASKEQQANRPEIKNIQRQKKNPAPLNIMTHSQRVYEKYKNQNEVIQTDPQYQQTLRQTEVDDTDIKFLNQNSSSVSPRRSKKQKAFKINPIPSQKQQRSPMVIISQQFVRKGSRDYKQKSTRKLSIQQTQRFKTYNEQNSLKHNLKEDLFGSVSNEQKIQKLSQLNLNPYSIQTNQFLYFLESYIEDISQNQELNQKNSIQKHLLNRKSKSIMEHSSDVVDYNDKKHLNTFDHAFKRSKPEQSKNQIHTYRPISRKIPLQSNRRQKYTQTYQKDQNKNSQIESDYPQFQNQDKKEVDSNLRYRFVETKQKKLIQLLERQLLEQRNDSITLARELQKYKFQQTQQKKQIILLSGTISELKKQVDYLEDQLIKINKKNQIITAFIKEKQSNNKTQYSQRKSINSSIHLQRQIKQKQRTHLHNFEEKQLFLNLDKDISMRLNLDSYRIQGAKDFYNANRQTNLQNIQSPIQQQQTQRKSKNESKNKRSLNSRSKGSYTKFNINELEGDELNYMNPNILNNRNKKTQIIYKSSSKRKKVVMDQLQNYQKIKQENRHSIQKMKAQFDSFRNQRKNEYVFGVN